MTDVLMKAEPGQPAILPVPIEDIPINPWHSCWLGRRLSTVLFMRRAQPYDAATALSPGQGPSFISSVAYYNRETLGTLD
jgi:hypothetical protein